jgi:uncharacterized protein YbjT (DUF2867 family)
MKQLAVVAGSLGDQGGAVASALAASGRRVRALSHNGASPAAAQLRDRGVEVVENDLNDERAVRRDLEGADELFAALTPFDEGGLEAEERQLRHLADAAAELHVSRVVYSGVGDPDSDRDRHGDELWGAERLWRERRLPLTLLRPAFFMENLDEFALRRRQGDDVDLRMPLDPEMEVQWIAVEDVAAFAVLAFDRPGVLGAGPVELAADQLSLLDAMRSLTEVFSWRTRYVRISLDEVARQSEHAYGMYRWFEAYASYSADIEGLRRLHRGLTLREWLEGGRLDLSKLERDAVA